ncbi:MAG: tetratricopeptide repeat protein [Elusimicrobia bacterium]|nr:tetratricopeptide repeat protein [Elusimicrobiota bacterium]
MNLLIALLISSCPLRAQTPPPADKPEKASEAEARPSAKQAPSAERSDESPAPKAEKAPDSEPKASAQADKESAPAKPPEKAQDETPAPPKPAKEPSPKAEPAPAAPSPGGASAASSEAGFLKAALEDKDLAPAPEAVEEAMALAAHSPETPLGNQARLLAAQLLQKREEHEAAAVAYLSYLYEYADPDSASNFQARRAYLELVDKKLARKIKQGLTDLAKVSTAASKADRLAAMLRGLVDAAGEKLYEPILAEFSRFKARFPAYKESDKVQMALADLHSKNSKYEEALHAFKRLIALHPESMQHPQALWSVAVLYADHLRKYDSAVQSFQELVKRYPKTPMVLPSLQRTAELLEQKIKDYPSAADAYEKIARLYPKTDGALKALQSSAVLQRDRLKNPAEAIATYKRLAEEFGPPAAVEALQEAAKVAGKSIKDFNLEAELRKLIASRFPDAAQAPEELFIVGELYEDSLKDDGKAKEAFERLASKYPAHKLAKKASDRVAKIEKRAPRQ